VRHIQNGNGRQAASTNDANYAINALARTTAEPSFGKDGLLLFLGLRRCWPCSLFTGLSVVANIMSIATVLSILTAVVAATVAAFQPLEAAKSHRAAATAYERLARKLDDVEALDLGDKKQQIPPEKIDPVRAEIAELEEELNAIELSHPPVSTFKHHPAPLSDLGHLPPSNFKHHIVNR
jgi:hypothetical protein